MQTNTLRNNGWMKVLLIVLVLVSMSVTWIKAANANPPGKMTFQGFLTDASNPPVPLGNASPVNKEITFKIYDNGTGGSVKWAETQIVTIDKGHFSVLLGEGSSVSGQPHSSDLSTVFSGADASDRWMGITVDSAEITPRIQFFAAPYAQLAKAANSLTGSAITASGNVNVTGDIKSSGNGAALFFQDRSIPANTWGWYADNDIVRLWLSSGGDKITMDSNGKITSGQIVTNGSITSGGSGAGLRFVDRGNPSGTAWEWLSSGGVARLWHGADKITVNDSAVINSGGLQVTGSNFIQLGHGVNREASAGQIGYETHGAGALHIIGAGTAGNNRNIALWDRVGIGTRTPDVPLHVASVVNHTSTIRYYFDHVGGIHNWGGGAFTGNYSAKFAGFIQAAGFYEPSDLRIKKIDKRISGSEALDSIRDLHVTDYWMIDEVSNGGKLERGFIAQEVKETLPLSITRSEGVIPDVYSKSTSVQHNASDQLLKIEMDKAHGLEVGDNVSLVDEETGMWETSVTDVDSPTCFTVKSDRMIDQVFVYGKNVEDFMSVDYDYVFTTSIGAIQELDRQVQALKQSEKRITELEQQVERMTELEAKAARVDVLEKQVAELNALVAGFLKNGGASPATLRRSERVTQ